MTPLQINPQILHSPRSGPGVCAACFNLTRGSNQCLACSRLERHVAAMVPISYSVGNEYLHHLLSDYKRLHDSRADAAAAQLSAALSLFLVRHEGCLARAARVDRFAVVTTVPSGDPERDEWHPLRRIVGELVDPTRARHVRLLRRSAEPVQPRLFDERRFCAVAPLDGEDVLLIDDTWTTGASVQSAAAALRHAGAGVVGAVVIGRYLNREWHENDEHLDALPFDWAKCAICADDRAWVPDEAQVHSDASTAKALEPAA